MYLLKGDNPFKMGLFLSLLLLVYGIIMAAFTPAQGFEASIYYSTPIIFWIAIIITMSLCVTYIVSRFKKQEFDLVTICVLITFFLCYFLVSSLFIIRGYYMWGNNQDPADHIG